jgi:MFS family permease
MESALRWPLVVLVCLGVWLHAADALVATTVMPSAIAEIGGLPYLYWTIALYELGSIVTGAASGLLTQRLGLRTAMSAAAGVYMVGCATSALASHMSVMLVGRLVQGFGGGAMLALSYVGVSQLFPPDLWPRVLAIVAGVWGVSSLVGPLVGGAFASAGVWRGAFWAFAAQAALLVAAAPWLAAARTPPSDEAAELPGRQLVALTAGVLAIAAAGVQHETWVMAACSVAGIGALALTLRLERNATARLFPPSPLSLAVPWGPGYVAVLLLTMATVSFTVYGPLLLARLFGVSPLLAGLLVAAESVAWTLAAIATANAPAHRESLLIRGGTAAIAIAVAGLAWTMPRGPVWALGLWTAVQGAGFGICWAFLLRRIVAGVPDGDSDRASAAVPTTQMIGYAIGAAVCGMVANALGLHDDAAPDIVRGVAFWVFAAFFPLAGLGALSAWRIAR